MDFLTSASISDITRNVVPEEFTDRDEIAFRQMLSPEKKYRALSGKEIERLVQNNNHAESWQNIMIAEGCDIDLIRNCEFIGLVRIGVQTKKYLEYHKMRLPVGLYDSLIISSDIGDDVVIRDVHYLSRYVIADSVILFNIDEMYTVDNAKFGLGILKKGEKENVRVWLEVSNENGGRRVLPFPGMLSADAYIWSRYREDDRLLNRLVELTQNISDDNRGHFGYVGKKCVIKDTRIIKNVRIGENCYIKGANKLKNLTIQSSAEEPGQIGEGVELVNGIMGPANKIFYGCKCVRFMTGRNVQIKYGARVLNSYLGCNSTVSCCEILNNLIFPFHEQHHNNSFLIASTVLGQSNIAAGATIGSNHNSRAADGEIIAGRGFWPGLQSSFKHNSVFSSFSLIAKGSYEAEMNIKLPFSLVSRHAASGQIQIFPAFWFRYNMYALARNSWKFHNRDKRVVKDQNIELDYLAPDSISEMLQGMDILKNAIRRSGAELPDLGDLNFAFKDLRDISVDDMVNREKALLIKPLQGLKLYNMMIDYFCARQVSGALSGIYDSIENILANYTEPDANWVNAGGQLIMEKDMQQLLADIKSKKLKDWKQIHRRYNDLWQKYPQDKLNFALYAWMKKEGMAFKELKSEAIKKLLEKSLHIDALLLEWTTESRAKDYSSEFRKITYRNEAEMEAVLGKLSDNSFIKTMTDDHAAYKEHLQAIIKEIK